MDLKKEITRLESIVTLVPVNGLNKWLKQNKHISLYKEIEIPVLKVLASMEIEGINLDVAYLNKLSKETDKDIEKTKNIIY